MSFDFDKEGLDRYIPNVDAESVKGVWIPFPGERELLILRAGGSNKKFLRAHQAALKPYRAQIDKGSMDDEVLEGIARSTYARHIVKDWRGINDSKGQPIPFSVEACEELFKAFPEMFRDIINLSAEIAVFNELAVEEAREVMGEA